LTVTWYGLLLVIGFLVGLWTSSRRGVRDGLRPDDVFDSGTWLIIGTIVGARALHVTTYWEEGFAGKPWWEVFMIHRGGLVFYGGLIGASAAGILYTRWKKVPLWKLADALAPGIALGYVIGRIGCLMNGCCFGRVCDLPWAIQYPHDAAASLRHVADGLIAKGSPSLHVHPSQIYDSLLSLGLYVGLAWWYRRKKFDGQVFALYLIGYAITRSIVETFRGDYTAQHLYGGLTPAHLISIGIFSAGVALFWILRRKRSHA
jgi:phosphatidylglycerol:prolipoprotein diacylglycerol transferase